MKNQIQMHDMMIMREWIEVITGGDTISFLSYLFGKSEFPKIFDGQFRSTFWFNHWGY